MASHTVTAGSPVQGGKCKWSPKLRRRANSGVRRIFYGCLPPAVERSTIPEAATERDGRRVPCTSPLAGEG